LWEALNQAVAGVVLYSVMLPKLNNPVKGQMLVVEIRRRGVTQGFAGSVKTGAAKAHRLKSVLPRGYLDCRWLMVARKTWPVVARDLALILSRVSPVVCQ
jgi:hypothetical protein